MPRAHRDRGPAPARSATRARRPERPGCRQRSAPQSATLHRALEAAAGGEARHARRRDLDALARAWVDAQAGAALANVELAEPRDRHVAAAAQGVLDRGHHGLEGARSVLL